MRYLVVALLLTACSSTTTVSSNLDGSAQLACQRFAEMARDIELTTLDEERQAAQEIWDKAQTSDDATIVAAAHDMLEALTNSDNAELRSAVTSMNMACT
jgi:hypothetical protein